MTKKAQADRGEDIKNCLLFVPRGVYITGTCQGWETGKDGRRP